MAVSRNYRRWSEEELETLKSEYPEKGARHVADLLKRNVASVESQVRIQGIKRGERKLIRMCQSCDGLFWTWPSCIGKYCSMKCVYLGMKAGPHKSADWSRLGQVWRGMKRRCTEKKFGTFAYYGGRGIAVCDEWMSSFEAFYEWAMANGYGPTLELDRIDTNGSYRPENCRWATRTQQMQNTRSRRGSRSQYKGVSLHSQNNRWRAQIVVNKKHKSLGCYATEIEAAEAYDDAAKEYFGEFAVLNFPRKECAQF
jgi:hypothetical protein